MPEAPFDSILIGLPAPTTAPIARWQLVGGTQAENVVIKFVPWQVGAVM